MTHHPQTFEVIASNKTLQKPGSPRKNVVNNCSQPCFTWLDLLGKNPSILIPSRLNAGKSGKIDIYQKFIKCAGVKSL